MSLTQLKALVAGMGVLIVAGLAVIVVTIVHRATAPREAAAPPGTLAPPLPAGAVVVETALDGDRLALRLDTPDGPRVAIVDLATGALVTTVVLPAAP